MAFNKLKSLMDDAKNAAVQHLGQENVDNVMSKMEKLKERVDDAKNAATQYLEQDSVERAITRMEWQKEADAKKASRALEQEASKEKKHREYILKSAPQILASDFDKERENCIFFINNKYDEPYTQSEWAELYKKFAAENDPQAFIPMYNAIVLFDGDELTGGWLRRRGLETFYSIWDSRQFGKFSPGINDKISDLYAIEPYTYHKATLDQWSAFHKAHPIWYQEVVHRSSSQSASAPNISYSAPAQNQPQKRQGLNAYERAELNQAKGRYERAVGATKRHPESARIYEAQEKQAYADYMRILAKYAGRE